jgi:acyl-CoA thioesterase
VTPFERDTAVARTGDGGWTADCRPDWFAPRGPNGGYIAATILRAMQGELALGEGAGRPVRSLTLHYLRPPLAGPLEISVRVERTGRSLSNVTARLEQDGRLCVIAAGAFSVDFPAPASYADPAPDVAPPKAELYVPPEGDGVPAMALRFATSWAIGPPPLSGGDQALTGGWIGFAEGPEDLDAPALAMLTDAWLPSPFTRLQAPLSAPTVDLTIHFRAPELAVAAPVLCVFRSRFAHGGFFEEDGELWSADGVLLAQSRQLALLIS